VNNLNVNYLKIPKSVTGRTKSHRGPHVALHRGPHVALHLFYKLRSHLGANER